MSASLFQKSWMLSLPFWHLPKAEIWWGNKMLSGNLSWVIVGPLVQSFFNLPKAGRSLESDNKKYFFKDSQQNFSFLNCSGKKKKKKSSQNKEHLEIRIPKTR